MLLVKSLRDYLTAPIIGASLLALAVPFLLLLITLFFGGSYFWDYLNSDSGTLANELPFWYETLLKYAFIKWLTMVLFYSFGAIFVLLLSVIVALITIGFFTPWIVKRVYKKEYSFLKLEGGLNRWEFLKEYLTIFFKFIVILLLSAILFFIPIVNLFSIYIPFFYLFYEILILDVAGEIFKYDEFKKIKNEDQGSFLLIILICFLISLVPFIGLFLQPFFVIYLTHHKFQKVITSNKA
ncbi:MAG: EI24 domain-containing protein [Sulfurospirillaceae bacterium]|nr:EI24 domain-containing protein [Sulfurospirillaceae bacterium]